MIESDSEFNYNLEGRYDWGSYYAQVLPVEKLRQDEDEARSLAITSAVPFCFRLTQGAGTWFRTTILWIM